MLVLLPSKAIPTDQAMLAVGGQVLTLLDRPGSISAVWDRLIVWRRERGFEAAIPFWWFALSLDVLFAIGAVELHDGELSKVRDAT